MYNKKNNYMNSMYIYTEILGQRNIKSDQI